MATFNDVHLRSLSNDISNALPKIDQSGSVTLPDLLQDTGHAYMIVRDILLAVSIRPDKQDFNCDTVRNQIIWYIEQYCNEIRRFEEDPDEYDDGKGARPQSIQSAKYLLDFIRDKTTANQTQRQDMVDAIARLEGRHKMRNSHCNNQYRNEASGTQNINSGNGKIVNGNHYTSGGKQQNNTGNGSFFAGDIKGNVDTR
ncbi:hypothetical protein CC86DRAFT_372248 [Ophiobolus disseminans]|uniref:Uncharacterized protein n=1 Tax=Ophiobolus disseminans TaxID=1469910 RepID=A0A6A6ZSB6_9PLEO|nr:hypothetical protein CC86DRAFT_372248 [Ophiobolus disseminans]